MESSRFRLEAAPHCPACGSAGQAAYTNVTDRLYGVGGQWSYSRCPGCGTLWLNPRPIAADLARCYPSTYFTKGLGRDEGRGMRDEERPGSPSSLIPHPSSLSAHPSLGHRVLASAFGYEHLAASGRNEERGTRNAAPAGPHHPSFLVPRSSFLPSLFGQALARIPPVRRRATHNLGIFMVPYRAHGRLLDVGCGDGSYLAKMRHYGWEVAGIEPDPAAAEAAQRAYGLRIHPGSVADAPFPPASFDVITGQQVLEHIADPLPFLEALVALLKPDGRLLLVMPNAASLGQRWFGTDCFSLDPPRHLALYTLSGLRCLLQRLPGLRVTHLRTSPKVAPKIFKQWRAVRRTDRFVVGGFRAGRGDRLAALGFSLLESAVNMLVPVGEEIEVITEKRRAVET